jgi:hypothetical protein
MPAAFAAASEAAQASLTKVFTSVGHAKSGGAKISVKYPDGWTAQEGKGRNTLQSFLGPFAGVQTVLSFAIETHEDEMESACAEATPKTWREGFAAPNWNITKARVVKHQGKYGALLDIEQVGQVGKFVVHTRMQAMTLCHRRHIAKLSCITSGDTAQLAAASMDKIAPLCQQYFKSIAFK